MAYKNTTTASNPPHFIICDSVADFANLPTNIGRGTGGMSEEDNNGVPVGSIALAKTGESKMLFPDGTWADC